MDAHCQDLPPQKRKELFVVAICLLIGFVLRFNNFDQKSLWMDEIHTYNDSRDGLKGQLEFYQEDPTYLHPPLFFILTHVLYPFTKPERDLRIIPLIFGILSIPMMYYVAKLFSPRIAIPCTLSLTFMAYHISFSQEGRSYTLVLFLGMCALFFFVKYLKTARKLFLLSAAIINALMFYINYTSILFIFLSQMLWFYGIHHEEKNARFSSFFILNSLTFLFLVPWFLFILFNFKGHPLVHPFHVEGTGSFLTILYRIFADWTPHLPLMIPSILLLVQFPFVSENRRNALILFSIFILPIVVFFLACKFFHITHFISSKYFINFLPFFLIILYLSLDSAQVKLVKLTRDVQLRTLFLILFIASNLVILPLYYRAEKQDFRSLVNYLKIHLHEGDKIFDSEMAYMPGVLHYFSAYPESRHQSIPFLKESGGGIEFRKSFAYSDKTFTIHHSKTCCDQYVADGGRLWILVGKANARRFIGDTDFILKGYFDGSFCNFDRFPYDASIYLFLYNTRLSNNKEIDIPIR